MSKLKDTHINWSAMHTYINHVLVLEYIVSWEVSVLFGHCLPLKEVLAVCFPESTRRWRTGTGGMVSSTARKEGGSNQIIHCKKGIVITTESLLF